MPDALNRRQRVFAEAHYHDAARHLALAIELGDAAAQLGTKVNLANVLDPNRRAARIYTDGDTFDV